MTILYRTPPGPDEVAQRVTLSCGEAVQTGDGRWQLESGGQTYLFRNSGDGGIMTRIAPGGSTSLTLAARGGIDFSAQPTCAWLSLPWVAAPPPTPSEGSDSPPGPKPPGNGGGGGGGGGGTSCPPGTKRVCITVPGAAPGEAAVTRCGCYEV